MLYSAPKMFVSPGRWTMLDAVDADSTPRIPLAFTLDAAGVADATDPSYVAAAWANAVEWWLHVGDARTRTSSPRLALHRAANAARRAYAGFRGAQ